MIVRRFQHNPIIRPDMDPRMGSNINGPSLIRIPDWVPNPLGKYYLYFAHHEGTYIRLAYADNLEGPWQIHEPGVLDLADSGFSHHVASPDVHVLEDRREIRMYFHGCCQPQPPHQVTRLAVSGNGLDFQVNPLVLGKFYWRVFRWRDHWYTLEMPGRFRRSKNGLSDFEEGPNPFTPGMRHSAVRLVGDRLTVLYSTVGDAPECLQWTSIQLSPDWNDWKIEEPRGLLVPETDWEGADCTLEPSKIGAIHYRVRQLRDPCLFQDGDRTYLLYSVAGEHGLAIGELLPG